MNKIMRRAEVEAVTGLCYTSIFNKMKQGKFPLSKQLTSRSVGWLQSEVQAWIDGLQATAFNGGLPVCPVDPLSLMDFSSAAV